MRMSKASLVVLLSATLMLVCGNALAQGAAEQGPGFVEVAMAFLTKYWVPLTSFIGSFAALAAVTPTKRDDTIVGYVTRFVDLLGANIGAAKNANTKGGKGG